jgi:hypothetical protein
MNHVSTLLFRSVSEHELASQIVDLQRSTRSALFSQTATPRSFTTGVRRAR